MADSDKKHDAIKAINKKLVVVASKADTAATLPARKSLTQSSSAANEDDDSSSSGGGAGATVCNKLGHQYTISMIQERKRSIMLCTRCGSTKPLPDTE
jgi:hypothetical protein